MPSPTQRCTLYLRQRGYLVGSTEKYVAAIRRRQDLFGFVDALAIAPGRVIGCQFCGITAVDAHRDKIDASPHVGAWLASGARLWVMAPHKRAGKWTVRTWERRAVIGWRAGDETVWTEISPQLDAEVLVRALRAAWD